MVKRRCLRIPALALLLLICAVGLPAQVIKLASPLPEGTEWDNTLRRMAQEWSDITGGQVKIRIYPGAIAGDEADMVRKMRINQIDAGVFTAFGLKVMVQEAIVMILPGLMRNEEELDWALDHFTPRFDERFREEGFEMMAWSKTGWAYFYGKTPLRTPDDLRRQILAISNTESEISSSFKALGFNVVPLGLNETIVALQSGLVNSFYSPPVSAAAFQWFATAPNMTDYQLAPVVGGLVLTRRAWERIPERYHAELKESMQRLARNFYAESIRLNDEAMRVMLRNGLKVVDLTDDEKRQWEEVLLVGHDLMVGDGKPVPTEIYRDLIAEIDEIRN